MITTSSQPPNSASASGSVSTSRFGRPLRVDAQRRRDQIVLAATAAFAERGDSVPLEAIAREAGVGIGTLYRNFPSREQLLEAVYAAELDHVTSNADDLLAAHAPEAALREWMAQYAEFIAAKRALLPALGAATSPGRRMTTRERVTGAIDTIVSAGVESRAFRPDASASDVTALLQGAFFATAADDGPERVARLLGLIVDSLLSRGPLPQ